MVETDGADKEIDGSVAVYGPLAIGFKPYRFVVIGLMDNPG